MITVNLKESRQGVPQFVRKRNHRLIKMLEAIFDHDDIILYGNVENPAVVYQGTKVLSLYVKNFDVHFADQPHNARTLHIEKLRNEESLSDLNLKAINDWFEYAEHRECFTIRVKQTNLKLTGWNFINPDKYDPKGKFPVFSEHKFTIYFGREYAEEIVEEYYSDTLKVEVV